MKTFKALFAIVLAGAAMAATAQTSPSMSTGTDGYVAACPVVIDSSTGLPMPCGPATANAVASGGGSLAFGTGQASGNYSIVIGAGTSAAAANSIAIGARAVVISAANNAVAIGADSIANQANTVSFGGIASPRRLVNVANGLASGDAATVGQLQQLAMGTAAWLGGGAALVTDGNGNWVSTAPTFYLSAPGATGSYRTVSSALYAIDSSLSSLYTTVSNLPPAGTGPQGPAGAQGPVGPQGPQGPAGESDGMSVRYDDAEHSSVTLEGASGTQIHNLAAGTASTDATNMAQLDAAAANAISTAKGYTDTTAARTLQSANEYTDWRIGQLNDRLSEQNTRTNRAGAVASAMGLMAGSAASLQNTDVLSMAIAGYRGESAVSLGLNHHFSERVALTVGAAFGAGNEGSVGAGLAIGLH